MICQVEVGWREHYRLQRCRTEYPAEKRARVPCITAPSAPRPHSKPPGLQWTTSYAQRRTSPKTPTRCVPPRLVSVPDASLNGSRPRLLLSPTAPLTTTTDHSPDQTRPVLAARLFFDRVSLPVAALYLCLFCVFRAPTRLGSGCKCLVGRHRASLESEAVAWSRFRHAIDAAKDVCEPLEVIFGEGSTRTTRNSTSWCLCRRRPSRPLPRISSIITRFSNSTKLDHNHGFAPGAYAPPSAATSLQ